MARLEMCSDVTLYSATIRSKIEKVEDWMLTCHQLLYLFAIFLPIFVCHKVIVDGLCYIWLNKQDLLVLVHLIPTESTSLVDIGT